MRLEVGIAHAPVLRRKLGRDELLAVALDRVRPRAEVGFVEAVGLAVPFQCTSAPPTPVPGRKLPQRRIGSAVWSLRFRNVNVSRTLSCISALRIE
jgi:hypothetical protein